MNGHVVQQEIDFTLAGGGTVYLLTPRTDAARTWLDDHVSAEAMYLGTSLAVEHRYIVHLLEGIQNDGLTVTR